MPLVDVSPAAVTVVPAGGTLRSVEFRVLGPLEVRARGASLTLGTPKQQCVLAMLALNAGRVVTLDDLVDELWPHDPPASALANVRGYAGAIRRLLAAAEPGADRLDRHGNGYVLHADADELDLTAFTAAVATGREQSRQQDTKAAAARYGEALALWRGPMLAGLRRGPHLAARCATVEETRYATIEDLAAALLALDEPDATVGLLRDHVRDHPLREHARLLLMRALYRLGDLTGALALYSEGRTALATHLGIEPSRELQQLHQALLHREPDPGSAPPPAAVRTIPSTPSPAQLPADVWGFTGRREQLARLDDILAGAGQHPTAVIISAIAGTAGVGKTAIAVHWAHQVREEFPDGQLYVNLRGFDPSGSPMSPAEALRGFLDALDVPARRIPNDLEAQIGLYRSLVSTRRMLVVLDNARDADQVRPLLPGAASSLVVVTSRNQLTGLVAAEGAHLVTLDPLTAEESRELLERRIGASRVADEPDAVREIVSSCARLPLALTIAAAQAATQPRLPLAALAGELRTAGGALDSLHGGDAVTDVRAVFSWSYRALGAGAARLFRLLGLAPGPDIGLAAVASLAGLPVAQVRPLLAELIRAHLLTEHALGRYTFHDLLRAYSTDLALRFDSHGNRQAALSQIFDHYLHTAHAATLLLHPYQHPDIRLEPSQPGCVPERLDSYDAALGWFVAEHAALIAAVEQMAAAGFDPLAWRLAWCLTNYLNRQGHLRDWLRSHSVALSAAVRLGDSGGKAHMHRSLGRVLILLGKHDDAHDHFQQALGLYQRVGVPVGQAHTHLNIAETFEQQSDNAGALEHAESALALYRAAGYRPARPMRSTRLAGTARNSAITDVPSRPAVRRCGCSRRRRTATARPPPGTPSAMPITYSANTRRRPGVTGTRWG